MRKKEDSINTLLGMARQAREHKISLAHGFPIDKSILEFSQNKGILTYRQARDLISQKSKIKKLENQYTDHVEKKLKFDGTYTWVLFHTDRDGENEPALFQESMHNDNSFISNRDDLRALLQIDNIFSNLNSDLVRALREFSAQTQPIRNWINQSFVNGTIENEIENYLKNIEIKKQNKTRISHALMQNFIDPKSAEIVQGTGELPALSLSERQLIQYLIWKAENMNEAEIKCKNLLSNLLYGHEENSKNDNFLVVFEEKEAIRLTYGNERATGRHYNELKDALASLDKKKKKILLKTSADEVKLELSLIEKIEFEHKYLDEKEFKKYTFIRIPNYVLQLNQKYTSYPNNHFAVLRNTEPKTNLTDAEAKFFDLLYREISYTANKSNTLIMPENELLKLLDADGSLAKSGHLSYLKKRITAQFIPKAYNLGILENFEIKDGKTGEAMYYFIIAPRLKIPALQ